MATATFTTVVDRAVGDPVTEAIWDDQLRDNVNQLGGAHRNLLTNGGFEIWQRGAGSFVTTTSAFTADRWQANWGVLGGSGSTTVTQETSIVDAASVSALKAVVTVTAAPGQVNQKLEDYTQLRGKTVSFSIRVRQSVASAVTPWILDTGSYTNGATVATTGSFVTLTVSAAIGAGATGVSVGVNFGASGTYYLDNAMLVVGPAPAPYQPLHPQEELARCQRYYEVSGAEYLTVAGAGGQNLGYAVTFVQPKGGTPTLTKNGTWGVTNCAQPSVTQRVPLTTSAYTIIAASTAAGLMQYLTNATTTTVTAEWNP